MAEFILENYGYQIALTKLKTLSISNLVKMRRKFDISIKHNNAARKLQKWWKKIRPSKRPKYDLANVTKLLQGIKFIQCFWRGYLQMKKDKANLIYHIVAAKKIQKAFRETHLARKAA